MRKLALAAGGMAVALTLTACGGDAEPDNGLSGGGAGTFGDLQQLVSSVEGKAEQVQSVTIDGEMTMLGMHVTYTGQSRMDPTDYAMSMTMSMLGHEQEIRILDETLYMKSPTFAEPGKPWVTSDMSEQFAEAQTNSSAATMIDRSDPRKTLERLQEVGGTITDSEATTLDGQPVTRYTVEVDAAELLKSSGDEVPAEMLSMMESLGTMPTLLYLNSENLPVRMELEMDMSDLIKEAAEAAGEEIPAEVKDNPDMLTMSMIQNFRDWGEPVTIEAPPADQVSSKPLEDF